MGDGLGEQPYERRRRSGDVYCSGRMDGSGLNGVANLGKMRTADQHHHSMVSIYLGVLSS